MLNHQVEQALQQAGYCRLAGVDEVGRGCLAGPVVAAACLFHSEPPLDRIRDSKVLSPDQRQELLPLILQTAYCAIGVVSAYEIDRINILQATHRAMRLAVRNLPIRPDCVLVDGPYVPMEGMPSLGIFQGDALSYTIGAASIVAKEFRDQLMKSYAQAYPQYEYEVHKGYPTKGHIQRLALWGASPIQRVSFRYTLPGSLEEQASTASKKMD